MAVAVNDAVERGRIGGDDVYGLLTEVKVGGESEHLALIVGACLFLTGAYGIPQLRCRYQIRVGSRARTAPRSLGYELYRDEALVAVQRSLNGVESRCLVVGRYLQGIA